MISVTEAQHDIQKAKKNFRSESVRISTAINRVLYKDVFSSVNLPPFNQSAMDGYAVKLDGSKTFTVIGESKAGDFVDYALKKGEAIRIFTGALVPQNADTVIIQEHVVRQGSQITIQKKPEKHSNIRFAGEQIKQGYLALPKGTQLNAAAIGFLASLGVAEVSVFASPKVAIIVTGDELQNIYETLQPGKIYESNANMLYAALQDIGVSQIELFRVKDTFEATTEAIKKALKDHEMVLTSGGISVGDYDFIKHALEDNKVMEVFYKVNQKPGKPLWFGIKENTFVFALPGNPASALTCFYVYVLPLIKTLMGFKDSHLKKVSATSMSVINNPSGKTLFLKAKFKDACVELLSGQSSAMMQTYALSNALIVVDANTSVVNKGDDVLCYKLN